MLGAVHGMSHKYCLTLLYYESRKWKAEWAKQINIIIPCKPCQNNHFCILVCGKIFNNFISVDNTRINNLILKKLLKGVFPQIVPKRAFFPT